MAEQAKLDAIAGQTKGLQVSEELFMVLQEMNRNLVYFNNKEEMWEAHRLLNLENIHNMFDDFIQRASTCVFSIPIPLPPSTRKIKKSRRPIRPPLLFLSHPSNFP
ncbi:hypothetical protein COP2_003566 [Malus domestica]